MGLSFRLLGPGVSVRQGRRRAWTLGAASFLGLALAGCGGADLMSSSRSGGLDNGLTGNYGSYGSYGSGYGNGYGSGGGGLQGSRQSGGAVRGRGTYPMVETSFELPDVKGNPFDYTENNVLVTFSTQDGRKLKIPAFYDGGKTWRARCTPDSTGRVTVTAVSLNGKPAQPDKFDKREFDVSGEAQPGFIRRDERDRTRFAFDNGNSYFPIGNNEAWGDGKPGDIEARLEKMGKAGENWSRIWMDHWDGKNLDWLPSGKVPPGQLSLDVAKTWDAIVAAAQKSGIHFQMVLQHHGQYSSKTDSNWAENPWNKKNGGFLSTPDEFFTDPRAIALTKAKYRYIIARWSYSPAILSWELFNEVQWTDSIVHKHENEVAAWHNAMAAFIREQDPYKHLITSSSSEGLAGIWKSVDYLQPHAYPPDALASANLDSRGSDRPVFYGEFGPSGRPADESAWMHRALWASLMSGASGAAQLWNWNVIDKVDFYPHFRSASDFVRQSGLLSKRGLLPAAFSIDTKDRATLSFGPGAGWASTTQTDYAVSPSGTVQGLASLPSYFQGTAHRDMFPGATFKVNYPADGTFSVTVDQISGAGAHLIVSIDGAKAAEKDFPGTGKEAASDVTVEAKVAAGSHDIKVENTGADWARVKRISLSSYAPTLEALGRADKDYAVLWIANRAGAGEAQGKVTVSGLKPAAYRATWWDTAEGKTLSEESVTVTAAKPLELNTPTIAHDVAVYVEASGDKSASKKVAAGRGTRKKGEGAKG